MSCFKNALIFGDQNFSSGDHFTKESRQKATSEKLELEALFDMVKLKTYNCICKFILSKIKYSKHFANFILDILIKYILIK